jgi:hypothetical protein
LSISGTEFDAASVWITSTMLFWLAIDVAVDDGNGVHRITSPAVLAAVISVWRLVENVD